MWSTMRLPGWHCSVPVHPKLQPRAFRGHGRHIAGALALSALVACAPRVLAPENAPAPPAAASMPSSNQTATFAYSDGSANQYEFDVATRTLVYTPVTPDKSSSGTYSGGTAWRRVLTEVDRDALISQFARALSSGDPAEGGRGMGTGLVERKAGDGSAGPARAILRMNTPSQKEIEGQLKALAPGAAAAPQAVAK